MLPDSVKRVALLGERQWPSVKPSLRTLFLSNDRLSTVCMWSQVSGTKRHKEEEEKDEEADHSSSVVVKALQHIPVEQQRV